MNGSRELHHRSLRAGRIWCLLAQQNFVITVGAKLKSSAKGWVQMPYATESSPLSFTHENGLKLTHLPAYSSKDLCSARDLKMICYWQSHQKKILTFLIENQQLWKLTVFSDKVLMRPTNIILQIIITLRLDVLWLKSSTLQRKRPVRYISIWPHKKKKNCQ